MADRNTVCYWMFYTLSAVETNFSWNPAVTVDAITVGIVCWWGPRAAALLERLRDEAPDSFSALPQSLKDNLSAHPSTDQSFWAYRYLTQAEANQVAAAFEDEENHAVQEDQAIQDASEYVDKLEGYGFSLDDPKPMVFIASALHQSPASALQVISSVGGSASLETLLAATLNHGILGQYRNRYNTVYDLLKDWDGESMPPDFGQNGDASATGGNSGISRKAATVTHILSRGNQLVAYGTGGYRDGVVFYPAGSAKWVSSVSAVGEEIDNGFTGGGSAEGSEAQNGVVDLFKSWEMSFAYGQGPGRLDPVASGYGDCSSTCWRAYQDVSGVNCGTWTGDMVGRGTLIAEGTGADQLPVDKMQPADLVLICWYGYNPSFDHVEMYVGDNSLWGHGGPGNGPHLNSTDARNFPAASGMTNWQVRRYL